jgi:hypothetical protein
LIGESDTFGVAGFGSGFGSDPHADSGKHNEHNEHNRTTRFIVRASYHGASSSS